MIGDNKYTAFHGNVFPLALHNVITAAQKIEHLLDEVEAYRVGKPIKDTIEARFVGKPTQHASNRPTDHRVLCKPRQTFGKGLFNAKHDRLPWF
ncbi:hypothetical protein GCM10010872_17850 [Dyella flava]|nr:hypothetical protein GCM10010872_17850 [Dyella flava]